MSVLVKSAVIASPRLTLDDFAADAQLTPTPRKASATRVDLIDGLTVSPLVPNIDERGSLTELLTTRDGPIEPIVHVYQVTASAGSIRAWVYHSRQYDRLAFVTGRFRIALYDIRPGSRTPNRLNVFVLGNDEPALVRIPPLVIHGVQNIGGETGTFINMPTRPYDPKHPDKRRLPQHDPRIPFSFDD